MIAAKHEVDEIARFIGLDSLHYLSIDGLLSAVSDSCYCLACFNGEYPLPPCKAGKMCLEDKDNALSW